MLPPKVTSAHPLPDYCLQMGFDNGDTGVLDLKPYLDFGVFARLRDPQVFAGVQVCFDTIEWPCGVDLDPAFVYGKCRLQTAA